MLVCAIKANLFISYVREIQNEISVDIISKLGLYAFYQYIQNLCSYNSCRRNYGRVLFEMAVKDCFVEIQNSINRLEAKKARSGFQLFTHNLFNVRSSIERKYVFFLFEQPSYIINVCWEVLLTINTFHLSLFSSRTEFFPTEDESHIDVETVDTTSGNKPLTYATVQNCIFISSGMI